jgi:SAM-dependent methyltransferase
LTEEERALHPKTAGHFRRLRSLSSRVLVCENVAEYRSATRARILPGDTVLEVGCHVGGTTRVVAEALKIGSAAGSALLGVDQRSDLIEQAKQRLPEVPDRLLYHVGDAFDIGSIRRAMAQLGVTKFSHCLIDISGSREIEIILKLVEKYQAVFDPSLILVKNHPLKRMLQKCSLWIDEAH